MLKRLVAGVAPPPPVGPRLWLTLGIGALGGLNLLLLPEIWAHTPAAKPTLLALEWLVLPPQLLWWGWRWLRACTGPGWLRRLATAGYLAGATLGLAGWVAALLGAIGALWYWHTGGAF